MSPSVEDGGSTRRRRGRGAADPAGEPGLVLEEVVGLLAVSAAPSASLRFGTSPAEDGRGGRRVWLPCSLLPGSLLPAACCVLPPPAFRKSRPIAPLRASASCQLPIANCQLPIAPLPYSSIFRLLGCTRGGSPGIFG